VIIRRLPPSMHKNLLLQTLNEVFPEGLPDHDYFRFCGSDLSFSPIPFSRAYINFKHSVDILNFKEKLDGYVFTDGKGNLHTPTYWWKMSNKTEILPSQKLEVPPTEYVFNKTCLSPASRGEQVKIYL
ncbi:regulator of nonsense transcripts 3A, partial [Paramuricea clavata]